MDREFHRLDAVDRFKELDPGIAADLDDIVNLAAHMCGAPVAIITLLGEHTQWFKSAVGTEVKETPREMSFCNYTIEQSDVLVVPDLSADNRYNNNPLVIGEPNVRFYAGSALTTKDGYGIGSLCVVDFHTRNLDDHQCNTLKVLSKQVINLMELNWSLGTLKKQNEALTRIAMIQSHELRRPVASLLGLMHLMRLENIDFDYFNMLEVTVNELNEKMRIIVEDSEDTINSPFISSSLKQLLKN